MDLIGGRGGGLGHIILGKYVGILVGSEVSIIRITEMVGENAILHIVSSAMGSMICFVLNISRICGAQHVVYLWWLGFVVLFE